MFRWCWQVFFCMCGGVVLRCVCWWGVCDIVLCSWCCLCVFLTLVFRECWRHQKTTLRFQTNKCFFLTTVKPHFRKNESLTVAGRATPSHHFEPLQRHNSKFVGDRGPALPLWRFVPCSRWFLLAHRFLVARVHWSIVPFARASTAPKPATHTSRFSENCHTPIAVHKKSRIDAAYTLCGKLRQSLSLCQRSIAERVTPKPATPKQYRIQETWKATTRRENSDISRRTCICGCKHAWSKGGGTVLVSARSFVMFDNSTLSVDSSQGGSEQLRRRCTRYCAERQQPKHWEVRSKRNDAGDSKRGTQ